MLWPWDAMPSVLNDTQQIDEDSSPAGVMPSGIANTRQIDVDPPPLAGIAVQAPPPASTDLPPTVLYPTEPAAAAEVHEVPVPPPAAASSAPLAAGKSVPKPGAPPIAQEATAEEPHDSDEQEIAEEDVPEHDSVTEPEELDLLDGCEIQLVVGTFVKILATHRRRHQ